MKILFLDVDDVLNHYGCEDRIKRADGSLYYVPGTDKAYRGIDDNRLEFLKEILYKTSCKIVVCSSWRDDPVCMDYLKKRLGKDADSIIGSTIISKGLLSRAEEVKKWLDENQGVESFVVLDDSEWNDFEIFGDRWVQPEMFKGMDESHRDAVIKKLS